MPQITYRANLSSAVYPMTLADAGRTVIVPGPDQNFDRRVDPAGEQKDAGIPQAIYMENVFPTPNGFQSVGYKEVTPIPIPITEAITACITLPMETLDPGIYIKTTLIYFSDDTVVASVFPSNVWSAVTTFVGFSSPQLSKSLSGTVCKGVTYICDSNSVLIYSFSNYIFTDITGTFVGIPAAPLNILSSYNYLILVDRDTVYWSSLITPTDFSPSLVSGAGSSRLINNRGYIVRAVEHPEGFVVYTNSNIIFARYTGNARYPWKFTEVTNSGGIVDALNSAARYPIAGDANSSNHFTINDAGTLQIINGSTAQNEAPEVSTYLSRSTTHDTFDYSTNTFTIVRATDLFNNQVLRTVYFYLDRYIIVPFAGTQELVYFHIPYEYAIVYDTLLQRYGKIKKTFDYIEQTEESQILFINATTGICEVLSFDIYDEDVVFAGVLVLGKFQYVRSRFLQVETVTFESVQENSLITPQFSAVLLPSLDGKTFSTPVPLVESYGAAGIKEYNCHKSGQNMTIIAKGAFNLNTLQLVFTPGGDR